MSSVICDDNGAVRFTFDSDPGGFQVNFLRTYRLAERKGVQKLPPGLGCFPLRSVEAFRNALPKSVSKKGGVFFPIREGEAMWMNFCKGASPFAIKVAAGKVNAVSGHSWSESLSSEDQDYLVSPPQPWLDGFRTEPGESVRQFVAHALGQGFTAEGQLTGEETVGGIQLLVIPPTEGLRERLRKERSVMRYSGARGMGMQVNSGSLDYAAAAGCRSRSMGLGAGAEIQQRIHKDPHSIEDWDQEKAARVFVHMVSPEMWTKVTGLPAPVAIKVPKGLESLYWQGTAPGSEHTASVDGASPLDSLKTAEALAAEKSLVKDGEW